MTLGIYDFDIGLRLPLCNRINQNIFKNTKTLVIARIGVLNVPSPRRLTLQL